MSSPTARPRQAGRSKRGHLEALHRRTGVPYPEIVFVDDKVNYLDDVASLGALGHQVCTLRDFEPQLFGLPPGPVRSPEQSETDC